MVDAVYTVGESSGVVSVCVQLQGEMEGMSATVQLSSAKPSAQFLDAGSGYTVHPIAQCTSRHLSAQHRV